MNYQRIYADIIERAKTRVPCGYVERHHIIPRCMGGPDTKGNMVALTPEEHFVAHVLLVKIYPQEKNLILAVQKMTRGHTGKRKRRLYGWLKRKHSARIRELQMGSGNSQFGTRWINDGKGSAKKHKGELPEGWFEGRRKWHKSSTTGTMWINDGTTNKLIHKTAEIPTGWKKGRIMNMITA